MNIDNFYSEVPVEIWKQVLDENMHYHFGIHHQDENPFEYAVKILYKFIPENSIVLDCGCGWGGPAKMLIKDLNCEVDGVTISKQQKDYIKDFPVYHEDLHKFIPPKHYNTALFLECYTHLENPKSILNNLYNTVDSIVIKDFASPFPYEVSNWGMIIRDRKTYYSEIESSGYSIKYYKEYKNLLHPSVEYWYKKIKLLDKKDVTGQLYFLYQLCRDSILTKYMDVDIRGSVIYAEKNK